MFIAAETDGLIEITVETSDGDSKRLIPVQAALPFSQDDLFHDDFMQRMDGWKISRGTWTVSQGTARASGQAHFAYVSGFHWQDYQYEVTLRCTGSSEQNVNWLKSYIFFRLQDEQNYYRFGIHGDAGVIDLYKCVDGRFTKLRASPLILKKDKWFTLRIEAKGAKLKGYINGRKILEADDDLFTSGGIGIGVLEDGMQCDYNSVVVKDL